MTSATSAIMPTSFDLRINTLPQTMVYAVSTHNNLWIKFLQPNTFSSSTDVHIILKVFKSSWTKVTNEWRSWGIT
jgi:hypothetical protein